MAVPELPTAVSRFHKESAWWMGPAAGVQHPHWRVILQAGTVDMAINYPIEAMAQAIPMDDRQPLNVFGPVNVAVANPKLWHVLLDGAHGR